MLIWCFGESFVCTPMHSLKSTYTLMPVCCCHRPVLLGKWPLLQVSRARPDWAYEFPDRTGPDTQICRTGPAGPDWIRTYIFKHFTYQVWVIDSLKIRSVDTNLVSKVLNWDVWTIKKIDFFLAIFKSVKSPASGKENVRFPDSPDFENLPDFRTGRDVR